MDHPDAWKKVTFRQTATLPFDFIQRNHFDIIHLVCIHSDQESGPAAAGFHHRAAPCVVVYNPGAEGEAG